MFEEIAELDAANENWTTTNYAVNMKGECADVVITMFRVAEMLGFDLQKAIDSKMAINRERKWRVSPEGIGYHV
jgi:NTP pyrophosphatase (non-canonical NTP hydrolase)